VTTRVVVADDVADLRWLLRAVFNTDERFEVVGEAADGREAIRVVDLTRPDVVLLDIRMPELDGLEVAIHLAAQAPATKVIFLTGVEPEVLPAWASTGDAIYLPKGASAKKILRTVAEAASRTNA